MLYRNNRMVLFLIFVFTAIVLCPAVTAFEWPVDEQTVNTTFGEDTGDGFNTGLYLLGNNKPVYPIADGEVIFHYEEGIDLTSLPRGLGSFVILYHEGGIHSVYGHLQKASLKKNDSRISRGTPLALIGNTGASTGGVLFLQIYDVEENILLNPLKQFTTPFDDKDKPVIRKIFFKRKEGGVQEELISGQVINSGMGNILVDTVDVWNSGSSSLRRFAPYRIILNRNGKEAASIEFDSIKEKNNHLILASGEKLYSDIYTGDGLVNLGSFSFTEGKTHLQVLIFDYSGTVDREGNLTTRDIFVTVKAQ